MDLKQIIAWLTEHEATSDMLDYLKGLTVQTPESVAAYLKTEDGKKAAMKVAQPEIDRRVTEGIETFKTNNLDRLVKEAYDKKHPPEDERDARIRVLEERDEQREAKLKRAEQRTTLLQKLGEEKLPVDLADCLIADSEDDTNTRIETYKQVFTTRVSEAVAEQMKLNKIPRLGDEDPNKDEVNPYKDGTWNLTKIAKLEETDFEKAKKLAQAAGKKTFKQSP